MEEEFGLVVRVVGKRVEVEADTKSRVLIIKGGGILSARIPFSDIEDLSKALSQLRKYF